MKSREEKIDDILGAIDLAFADVVLGLGISLRQAQEIDRYRQTLSDKEFDELPLQEITDDWKRIPLAELELDCVAHLDAEGYRYYIPAFLKSVLKNYDPSSMRVIGTLMSLYPKTDAWAYHMNQYDALNQEQCETLAKFLTFLPDMVPLDGEYRTMVSRALRNYWRRFYVEIHGI
jgi:hypothetical protein